MPRKTINDYMNESIQDGMKAFLSQNNIDPLVQSALDRLMPRLIEIQINHGDFSTKLVERQHYKTPLLVKLLSMGLPVLVWGPRGTGKSYVAEQVAIAMGYNPMLVECNSSMTPHQLTGYYWGSQFIEGMLYSHIKAGGFVIFDELDRLSAGTSVALNSLLAGGLFTFANRETVKKSSDFHILGLSNTQLTGATEQYRSAERQDAAFADRWIYLEWPNDHGLEAACIGLSGRISPAFDIEEGDILDDDQWFDVVRATRKWATDHHYQTIPGQRTTILGHQMFKAGIGLQHVCDCVLFRGWTKDQRRDSLGCSSHLECYEVDYATRS